MKMFALQLIPPEVIHRLEAAAQCLRALTSSQLFECVCVCCVCVCFAYIF